MHTAVDLFCGCGGIAAGLRQAGFRVLAGVDVDARYISTFEHNFPEAQALRYDITKFPAQAFLNLLSIQPDELDLIAGGPPCQGFSKNVPRKYRFLDDPRNLLIKTFLDYCVTLRPKMVLMENVAEMSNGFDQAYTEDIIARLQENDYEVTHVVLNAADYGVPQRRRRAFFLANRLGVKIHPPFATHQERSDSKQRDLLAHPRHVSVWEAIGDLPHLEHGESLDPTPYACEPFSDYQRLVRGNLTEVKNHVARFLRPTQYARLAALEPGQKHKDLPAELKVNGGYSGAYGRLTKEMIAPTITRWVFHPGSGRWGHPVDIRVLSIREVARIQGFPDTFNFVGTYVQQAGQLGNAVPPLLASHIAEAMRRQVLGATLPSNDKKSLIANFSASSGHLNVTA